MEGSGKDFLGRDACPTVTLPLDATLRQKYIDHNVQIISLARRTVINNLVNKEAASRLNATQRSRDGKPCHLIGGAADAPPLLGDDNKSE